MKNTETKSPFSKIFQIGILVRNMDRAVEYYESLGIGPFKTQTIRSIDRMVYGKPAKDLKNLVMATQVGPIELELVQPVSGESVQKEFLEKHGEGINHLAFLVDDLEQEVAKLQKKGFKVVSSGKFPQGGGNAYLNTDIVGGVIFELFQMPRQESTPR